MAVSFARDKRCVHQSVAISVDSCPYADLAFEATPRGAELVHTGRRSRVGPFGDTEDVGVFRQPFELACAKVFEHES
jgi:hypothetical protein